MRGSRCITVIILLLMFQTACATRQIRPVSEIDPAPLLEVLQTRQSVFEKGISGTVELVFGNGKKRFNGKVHVVAYPDGRFRLEVPTLFGGTHLVMTSDNKEILAFYPGESTVFRSTVDGRSMNPHLPFPLPLDPTLLPALVMGVFPGGWELTRAEAYLMDSGDKLLRTGQVGNGLQFTFLFYRGSQLRLREVTVRGSELNVLVHIGPAAGQLPGSFEISLPDGVLKGEWDTVDLFKGDPSVMKLRLPPSVTVKDLEGSP